MNPLPRRFKLVVPDDSFGKSNRYRQVRLLLETDGEYRAFFWFNRANDQSISFGLSHGASFDTFGRARVVSGRLTPFAEESAEKLPLEQREKVHATLHRSGACHVRAQAGKPLETYDLSGWYPVEAPFTWLYAFSEPVGSLPVEPHRRKQDALTTFGDLKKSARVRIDLLPANPKGEYQYVVKAVETLIHLGSEFVVRITIAEHHPVSAALAVAIAKPLSFDPL